MVVRKKNIVAVNTEESKLPEIKDICDLIDVIEIMFNEANILKEISFNDLSDLEKLKINNFKKNIKN